LTEDDTKKRTLTTPLKAKTVVPIILGAVVEMPGIAYQSLREIIKPYAKDYAWKGWHESCTLRARKGVCVIFE
jgi:hypothetical protein